PNSTINTLRSTQFPSKFQNSNSLISLQTWKKSKPRLYLRFIWRVSCRVLGNLLKHYLVIKSR
ncbi:hypothetical protein Leryth_005075, partial [Lithospermum erythrorhizon]